jgi:hypothetical protein
VFSIFPSFLLFFFVSTWQEDGDEGTRFAAADEACRVKLLSNRWLRHLSANFNAPALRKKKRKTTTASDVGTI